MPQSPAHPRSVLRWAVPAGAAAVVVGVVAASGAISASAGSGLPERTAAQLLTAVSKARVAGLSGTVVQRADLGLPEIPGLGSEDSSEFSSLVAGTHTLRVWAAGEDKIRLALLGQLGESDLIRNGNDIWVWSSKDKTAGHVQLPAMSAAGKEKLAETHQGAAMTPQQAAERALAAVNPTTAVTTSGTAKVAGRSAYELVLKPRDNASLVSSVRIAIDGSTKVPLRVQVIAKGSTQPAFEVGFTSVSFAAPDAGAFAFNPPPGTKVEQVSAEALTQLVGEAQKQATKAKAKADEAKAATVKPVVVGTGWSAVVVGTLGDDWDSALASAAVPPGSGERWRGRGEGNAAGSVQQVLRRLPKVSGDWGSGRLLKTHLLTAVITDDGRVAVGSVTPAAVYAALK